MATVTTSVDMCPTCSSATAINACLPSPVSGEMVAGGSGDFLGGCPSVYLATTNWSNALSEALPLPLAAANGWYDCAPTWSTTRFGLRSTVNEHWLSVLELPTATVVRPAVGSARFSSAGLTAEHELGTDLNSPGSSEVT